MRLRVIEGGRSANAAAVDWDIEIDREAVKREAARRLRAVGYFQLMLRAQATGQTVPATLHHLKLQIDYVADTLARLTPIPTDFRSDVYWPG